LNDEGIAHRIEHLIPCLAVDQNSFRTQNREMLRGVSLFHSQALDQRTGGEFPFTELLDNCNPSGMRESLKEFSLESAKSILHFDYIRSFEYYDILPHRCAQVFLVAAPWAERSHKNVTLSHCASISGLSGPRIRRFD
jgi:hypothetical protein